MLDRTIVRQADFATEYSDGTILIKGVRVCYPHVFRPYKSDKDPPDKVGSHSIIGLLPKQKMFFPSKDIIRDKMKEVARAAKNPDLPADRMFLRDGNLRRDKPEMVGNFTISAAEKNPPTVLGPRRDPKTNKPVRLVVGVATDEAMIYGGMYCNLLIRPWWQSNQFGKRVNAGLVAVQVVPIAVIRKYLPEATDEAFGEGRISSEAIDDTFGDLTSDDHGYDDGLGSDLDNLDL